MQYLRLVGSGEVVDAWLSAVTKLRETVHELQVSADEQLARHNTVMQLRLQQHTTVFIVRSYK